MESSYIYGPVPSRRLGFSLGIDPIPLKTCSFDCIYCQLGRTQKKTIRRKEYLPGDKIIDELQKRLKEDQRIDYITFSGSGEPTLNSKIGQMIDEIKGFTDIPVAVLTNSSLLSMKRVRNDLGSADLVVPSLDAGFEKTFKVVNRPYPNLSLGQIVDGLIEFREGYPGKIYLEVMFIRGINDSYREIKAIANLIQEIKPDLVQLNTVYRPPAESYAHPVRRLSLKRIKEIFGPRCEIVVPFKKQRKGVYQQDIEELIVDTIKRRPATARDIARISGLNLSVVIKYLNNLVRKGEVKLIRHRSVNYYEFR